MIAFKGVSRNSHVYSRAPFLDSPTEKIASTKCDGSKVIINQRDGTVPVKTMTKRKRPTKERECGLWLFCFLKDSQDLVLNVLVTNIVRIIRIQSVGSSSSGT